MSQKNEDQRIVDAILVLDEGLGKTKYEQTQAMSIALCILLDVDPADPHARDAKIAALRAT